MGNKLAKSEKELNFQNNGKLKNILLIVPKSYIDEYSSVTSLINDVNIIKLRHSYQFHIMEYSTFIGKLLQKKKLLGNQKIHGVIAIDPAMNNCCQIKYDLK